MAKGSLRIRMTMDEVVSKGRGFEALAGIIALSPET